MVGDEEEALVMNVVPSPSSWLVQVQVDLLVVGDEGDL